MSLREKATNARDKATKLLNSLLETGEETYASQEGREAAFLLTYEDITIGTLVLQDGIWTFHYTAEFREQKDLRPIVEFPDTERTYRSTDLWPFFLMRIPSTKQEAIQKITAQEEIDITDQVQLLSRFGKETIANPYRLTPA